MDTLTNVTVVTEAGEYNLLALPWEVAYDLAVEADNVFEEMDAKPGLGVDDYDELAFMGATLDALRIGLTAPVQRLTMGQMEEIENERIGADFCERPYAW